MENEQMNHTRALKTAAFGLGLASIVYAGILGRVFDGDVGRFSLAFIVFVVVGIPFVFVFKQVHAFVKKTNAHRMYTVVYAVLLLFFFLYVADFAMTVMGAIADGQGGMELVTSRIKQMGMACTGVFGSGGQ
jgi:hypothetical protein